MESYDYGFEIAFKTGFAIVFFIVCAVILVKRIIDIRTNNAG